MAGFPLKLEESMYDEVYSDGYRAGYKDGRKELVAEIESVFGYGGPEETLKKIEAILDDVIKE